MVSIMLMRATASEIWLISVSVNPGGKVLRPTHPSDLILTVSSSEKPSQKSHTRCGSYVHPQCHFVPQYLSKLD